MPYDRRRHSRYARRLAYECKARANWQCEDCGSRYRVAAHHIVPLVQGGENVLTNLRCLCFDCHRAAHRKRPSDPWYQLVYLRQYGE